MYLPFIQFVDNLIGGGTGCNFRFFKLYPRLVKLCFLDNAKICTHSRNFLLIPLVEYNQCKFLRI